MIKPAGFSLLELLIAMLLALFVLGSLITLTLLGSKSHGMQSQHARLQENMRFGIELLLRGLRMAGYFGCAHDPNKVESQLDNAVGALTDVGAGLEGFEQSQGRWFPSGGTEKIDAMAANNDAITVRFANPSAHTETSESMPAADSGVPKPEDAQWGVGDVLIISDCDGADVFQTSSVTDDRIVPNKLSRPYNSGAELTSLWAARYFVAPSTSNGLPTLKRQILQGGGSTTTEELAQGVENLQFLFGEDQDQDGLPDAYRQAHRVTNWSQIVTIQVGLLLRSLEEFGRERDTAVYQVLDHAFDDPDDLRLRRRVIQYTVALRNSMP